MRAPTVSDFQTVDEPGGSTDQRAEGEAHGCFRGARLLLGFLVISIAIWVGLGWGIRALVSGL